MRYLSHLGGLHLFIFLVFGEEATHFSVSPAYWAAVLLLASAVDAYGLTKVNDEDYTPGDLKFDPLGLKKINPQWMETAEIKNGRLAMIAITGFAVQEFVSGNAAFAAL